MTQPPATRADLFALLDRLGIETSTVEHAAVFTVAESAALERDMVGGHSKNLFLIDAKGLLFLVVAEAHTAIDLKALPKVLGSGRLSFGKAEVLLDVLGITPGSVTAFAVINDQPTRGQQPKVTVVVDAALMAFDVINCHPLTNTATTSIKRDDLLRFLRETGHDPRILQLSPV